MKFSKEVRHDYVSTQKKNVYRINERRKNAMVTGNLEQETENALSVLGATSKKEKKKKKCANNFALLGEGKKKRSYYTEGKRKVYLVVKGVIIREDQEESFYISWKKDTLSNRKEAKENKHVMMIQEN